MFPPSCRVYNLISSHLHCRHKKKQRVQLTATVHAHAPPSYNERPRILQNDGANPSQALVNALVEVCAHSRSQDGYSLGAYISGMQPSLLADVVIACMGQLPTRDGLQTAAFSPWMHQMAAALATETSLPEPWPNTALPPPFDANKQSGINHVAGINDYDRIHENGGYKGIQAIPKPRITAMPMFASEIFDAQRNVLLRLIQMGAGAALAVRNVIVARVLSSAPRNENSMREGMSLLMKVGICRHCLYVHARFMLFMLIACL
jgi:hypothetical protein